MKIKYLCIGTIFACLCMIISADELRDYIIDANQGNANAEYNLSIYYLAGNDIINKDIEQAVYWCRKAAEHGHIDAQYNLGQIYYKGKYVRKNYDEAAKWYRKAAEQGHANAQYYLSLCYQKGNGVPKNINYALYWCRKAAEYGNSDAQRHLKTLISIQKKHNYSCLKSEGFAWARLLTSPLDVVSPMLTTYYHIYTDKQWNIFESILATPFIPIVSLPPGVTMFIGDIFGSLFEISFFSTIESSYFPWECFDYEIAKTWNQKYWEGVALAIIILAAISESRRGSRSYSTPHFDYSNSSMDVTPNAYGPGVHSDQFGRPVQYSVPNWPANEPTQNLQVKPNVYGPGIGQDQFGRPVNVKPLF